MVEGVRAPRFALLFLEFWLRLVRPLFGPRPGVRPLTLVCMVDALLATVPATDSLIVSAETEVVWCPPSVTTGGSFYINT
jgi:hypothetical protein